MRTAQRLQIVEIGLDGVAGQDECAQRVDPGEQVDVEREDLVVGQIDHA